jgi:hypothetical protein
MAFDNNAGYRQVDDRYQQNAYQQGAAQDNLRAAALCDTPGQPALPGQPAGPGNWRPDPNSAEGQQWVATAQSRLFQPLQLNRDGTYTAQPFDSLDTIAAREIHMANQPATKSAIAGEVQRIIQMNQDRYPGLASNPEFLGNGWTLRLSDAAAQNYQQPPQADYAPPQRVAQPLPPADVPPPQRVVQPAPQYAYQPNPGGELAAGVGGFIGGALMTSLFRRPDYGYYDGYGYGGNVYYGGGYHHPHYWHRR